MSTKLKKGTRVRCRDTKELGKVVDFRDDMPVVEFDNGAVGVCKAAEDLSKPKLKLV